VKRVVLVRPRGPRNVGMVLRATLNFGPCELALVAPERPSILVHPEFEQMSHGARAARDSIRVSRSLASALEDCTASVGFTARVRGKRVRRDWRDARGDLEALGADPEQRLALVFGSEESGLTAEEAALVQDLIYVRTAREHTSLNLAMSVGIVLAGLFTGEEAHQPEPGGAMLSGDGREFLKARLKEVLAGDVARTASAARDISASIERVFSRAPLENRDARAWHLMLRALGSRSSPGDFGLDPTPKGARRADALGKRRAKDSARDRARGRAEGRDGCGGPGARG